MARNLIEKDRKACSLHAGQTPENSQYVKLVCFAVCNCDFENVLNNRNDKRIV